MNPSTARVTLEYIIDGMTKQELAQKYHLSEITILRTIQEGLRAGRYKKSEPLCQFACRLRTYAENPWHKLFRSPYDNVTTPEDFYYGQLVPEQHLLHGRT